MTSDLARAIAAATQRVDLSATPAAAVQKKLTAVFIDPLMVSMNLDQVRGMRDDGHGAVVDDILRDMTLAQLKKASKKWNPHRKIAKDTVMRDLQLELRDLAAGRTHPASPAPKATKRKTAKHPSRVAAE